MSVNAHSRSSLDLGRYPAYYGSLITAPDEPATALEAAARDFAAINEPLRWSILAAALRDIDDATIVAAAGAIGTFSAADDGPFADTPPSILLRGEFDRLHVAHRLWRLGMAAPQIVNQDDLLAQIVDPANEYAATTDDLFALREWFDPSLTDVAGLAEWIRRWSRDPAGGAQPVKDDDGHYWVASPILLSLQGMDASPSHFRSPTREPRWTTTSQRSR